MPEFLKLIPPEVAVSCYLDSLTEEFPDVEEIPTMEADGRVLAEAFTAPHPLPPGGGAVLAALMAGATVAAACDAAPDCDIAALFSLLLSGGAITEVEESP